MSTAGTDALQDPEWQRLQSLCTQVQARSAVTPQTAILLGTGLGGVAEAITVADRIPFAELDGMPQATAESHAGEVILGELEGVPVVAFSGRLHCYEGHSSVDVVVPVRLAKLLGCEQLIMGSAVGGLDPRFQLAQVVVIEDHINFIGANPLVGPNCDALGPRWPDMIETYNEGLIKRAQQAALEEQFALDRAVYVGVLGPNLETRAEYRMLRNWGADIVGMSTVPEAIAAVHCGLKTLALAVVTDRCQADALEAVNIESIIGAAAQAEPQMVNVIRRVLRHQ